MFEGTLRVSLDIHASSMLFSELVFRYPASSYQLPTKYEIKQRHTIRCYCISDRRIP